MSKTTEVCFDISSGAVSGSVNNITKGALVSNDCVNADQAVNTANVKYVNVTNNSGDTPNDVVVQSSFVNSFTYDASHGGLAPGGLSGEFLQLDLFQSGVQSGTIYFDTSGISGISSPSDVTFRVVSENPSNLYPTVIDPFTGNIVLLLSTSANLNREFILKVSLAQSFSNLKRSYRSIQAEKKFKSNDDYLRKLKTFKTRKNNCQHE